MNSLVGTLIAAILVLAIGFLCLMIGWLLTGKNRLQRGSCSGALDASRKQNCDKQKTCSLCSAVPLPTVEK